MSERPRIEMTTAPFLGEPEMAFWAAAKINEHLGKEEAVRLELYPLHYYFQIPGPGRITKEKVRGWQEEYPSVEVERIHLPFHWGIASASRRFVTSFFKEQGTFSDRWTALKAAFITGTVQNRFALKLAADLNAGLNAHVYIVEAAEDRDVVGDLKERSRYVWVENDLDYPRKNIDDIRRARDPQRAIDAVTRNGLSGVIVGFDHAYGYRLDPLADFRDPDLRPQLEEWTRSVHLAGTKEDSGVDRQGGHPLIDLKDKRFLAALDEVKSIGFKNQISLCIDISPYAMKHLTPAEQLDYLFKLAKLLRD